MTRENPAIFAQPDDGVVTVWLNSPPLNLNSMESTATLLRIIKDCESDQKVRAIVIAGLGDRAFSAGSDVREFEGILDDVVERKLRPENETFSAIESIEVPVIAALNGLTLGGGAELALACDIRIMDETASIGFPEVNLGVFPGSGGTFRLARQVGLGRAYELLYTGEMISAAEAWRIGLVNRLVAPGKAVDSALELAHQIAEKPAAALTAIRTGLRNSLTQSLEQSVAESLEQSASVFRKPDVVEGLSAFFEKRPPRFGASREVKRSGHESA